MLLRTFTLEGLDHFNMCFRDLSLCFTAVAAVRRMLLSMLALAMLHCHSRCEEDWLCYHCIWSLTSPLLPKTKMVGFCCFLWAFRWVFVFQNVFLLMLRMSQKGRESLTSLLHHQKGEKWIIRLNSRQIYLKSESMSSKSWIWRFPCFSVPRMVFSCFSRLCWRENKLGVESKFKNGGVNRTHTVTMTW